MPCCEGDLARTQQCVALCVARASTLQCRHLSLPGWLYEHCHGADGGELIHLVYTFTLHSHQQSCSIAKCVPVNPSGIVFTQQLPSLMWFVVQEYVNGQLKNKYGDAFIRGNNGESHKRTSMQLSYQRTSTMHSTTAVLQCSTSAQSSHDASCQTAETP